MTNYKWLLSLDSDTFAQFLQHTIFVRNLKNGDKTDIGAKTLLINACVDIKKWLSEPQEFEVEHTIQNEGRMTMKTMLEDFFEKFPNAPKKETGEPLVCPEAIYDVEKYKDCGYFRPYDTSCRACWSRPVPPRRECYKNATVIVEYDENGEPDISWVRQEDTERIGYDEAMKRVIKVKAVIE